MSSKSPRIQKILKYSKRFQKIPKNSKRINRIPKEQNDFKRIIKVPKEPKRFQKNQKELKRFLRNPKDEANMLKKLISPPPPSSLRLLNIQRIRGAPAELAGAPKKDRFFQKLSQFDVCTENTKYWFHLKM